MKMHVNYVSCYLPVCRPYVVCKGVVGVGGWVWVGVGGCGGVVGVGGCGGVVGVCVVSCMVWVGNVCVCEREREREREIERERGR